MSAQNVEIVRRCLHWRATRGLLVEDWEEWWDVDSDYYPIRKFPESRACHGREEIARFYETFRATWDRYESGTRSVLAVGDDRVFAHTHVRAEGRQSGLVLDGPLYHSVWLRHGRILRLEDHLTLPKALFALGLDAETLEAAGLRE